MRIDTGTEAGLLLDLPAWIPGSYMIRDFARNLIDIRAYSEEQELALLRVDKQSWRLPAVSGVIEVRYRVVAWDDSVRTAYLDRHRAFFNGSSLFLRVKSLADKPHRLMLDLPTDPRFDEWSVATTLPLEFAERTSRSYRAENYEELIDHPFELGVLRDLEFDVLGVPHHLVLSGRWWMDESRVAKDLAAICSEHAGFFGDPLPIDRYLFLAWVVGDGYGGLEHRASSALIVSRHDLAASLSHGLEDGYVRFLGLCSHEYFHLWNVKRITPADLCGVDCREEAYTDLLWVSEGFTSYYDDLALVRSGVVPFERYLKLLGETITRVHRGAGRRRQSLSESSFYAWTKFYRQDASASDTIVSYYAKGALIALLLDDEIRSGSQEASSLDDLMRLLWREHGVSRQGFSEADLRELLHRLSMAEVDRFFEQYIHGRAELPLAKVLLRYGVEIDWCHSRDGKDCGGGDVGEANMPHRFSVGGILRDESEGMMVRVVYEGGGLHRAGIAAGDRLIAIDGLRASETLLGDRLRAAKHGDRLELFYFRRDELLRGELVLDETPPDTCVLRAIADDDLDPMQRERRARWLRGASRVG